MPHSVEVCRERDNGQAVRFQLNREPVDVLWLGEGRLRLARELIAVAGALLRCSNCEFLHAGTPTAALAAVHH